MVRNPLKKILSVPNDINVPRVFNFGAGPAMLPMEVMQRAKSEFLDWNNTGISVMEISHRSEEFISIAKQAESDLRELLAIPENYKVLFLQGGASSQFAMVPLNLVQDNKSADYFYTGHWSGKAIAEASRFCKVNIAASSENDNFRKLPDPELWKLDPEAAYTFYTSNETIGGVEFHTIPDVGTVPLVCDMTSSFLSHPLDVSRYGVIFASAQKNVGPAGLVIVIVRDDLIGKANKAIPILYDYATHARENSMFNTPPTYSWYMAGLVLQWIKKQGGLTVMQQRAHQKSEKLYRLIDDSDFYQNLIDKKCRSRINVPFTLVNEKYNSQFLSEAFSSGLYALAGHRKVGGMRASIYNAMPEEGVDALVDFMEDFEHRNG